MVYKGKDETIYKTLYNYSFHVKSWQLFEEVAEQLKSWLIPQFIVCIVQALCACMFFFSDFTLISTSNDAASQHKAALYVTQSFTSSS